MLRSLAIRNFAVISELRLEFSPGLTVFTGETGAGKSILIEALGFLMGERGSALWLRSGAPKLEVEGIFDQGDFPEDIRSQFNIAGSAAIQRELDVSGRSKAMINGRPAALGVLAALSEQFVDFHGQHEHQTLLKPAVQLELLDGFGGLENERQAVETVCRRWKELQTEASAHKLSDEERLRRMDLCRFQVEEIDEARPRPGEEEELASELPRIKNAARLRELAERAHQLLYEAEGATLELLAKAQNALEDMARMDPSLNPAAQSLAGARAQVDDALEALARYRENVSEGPERLDEILNRQDKLLRLKKKYGATLEEVLAHRDRAAFERTRLENHEAHSGEVQKALQDAAGVLAERNGKLHKARMKAAKRLSEMVAEEFKDLGMALARFSISVEMEEGRFSPTGCDHVEFLIAPNPGEPLKGLRAVASGGELSRVMLALKTVLSRQDRMGLLVFDEVDAGVGAMIGRAIGQKLAELARRRQVLAVTHLPQVACFADSHFSVSKAVSKGRTTTQVERLEGNGRLETIAAMLGGRKPTEASRRHAKELLESV